MSFESWFSYTNQKLYPIKLTIIFYSFAETGPRPTLYKHYLHYFCSSFHEITTHNSLNRILFNASDTIHQTLLFLAISQRAKLYGL